MDRDRPPSLLLVASITLHFYRDARMLDALLRDAGQDALSLTSALEELRGGKEHQALASLERLALSQLEIAAQRRERVAREVDLQPAIDYFRATYRRDPLADFSQVGSSQLYERIAALEFQELHKPGDLAPPLRVSLVGGSTFDLQEQRGRVVLLTFFATWCLPCRPELLRLESEVWRRYGERGGFEMVAIGRHHNQAEVAGFADELGLTMPVGSDLDGAAFQEWARTGIPRTYLIGRDGTIVGAWLGGDKAHVAEVIAGIEAALGEAEAGHAATDKRTPYAPRPR